MTGLLVSVRSAEEAWDALQGGAAMIDVKEPAGGALGAASAATWQSVLAAVDSRRPTSAALGELTDDDVLQRAAAAGGFDYAKVALAGCDGERGWRSRLADVFAALPPGVAPVTACYADRAAARSPGVWELLETSVELNARGLLIDTFDKRRGGLLTAAGEPQLRRVADAARQAGLLLVLAGSLRERQLRRAAALRPDYIGVRGAVCSGARTARLQRARVEKLARALRGQSTCRRAVAAARETL